MFVQYLKDFLLFRDSLRVYVAANHVHATDFEKVCTLFLTCIREPWSLWFAPGFKFWSEASGRENLKMQRFRKYLWIYCRDSTTFTTAVNSRDPKTKIQRKIM